MDVLHISTGCIVNVFFAFFGTLANGLVIICFWKSARLRNKLSYFLIEVLSWTDLIIVATVHPMMLVYWVTLRLDSPLQAEWFYSVLIFVGGLSGETLFLMNIEWYIAVIHPYFYERSVTKRRLLITLLLFYVIGPCSFLVITFTASIDITKVIASEIALLLISTSIIYIKIFVVAMRLENQVTAAHNSMEIFRKRSKALFNFKLAKTYVAIVAFQFVFYLPAAIMSSIGDVPPTSKERQVSRVYNLAEIWCMNFVFVNSTTNCLIFFWKTNSWEKKRKGFWNWFSEDEEMTYILYHAVINED